MRLKYEYLLSSAMCRVAAAGLLASALGACSTDVARFSDNPFSNPFKGGASTSVDRNATGAIRRQATEATGAGTAAVAAAPALGRVTSQPLSAPVAASVAATQLPSRSAVTPRAPSAVDLASTGSVTPRSVAGWSSAGGTPVVMASGENVNTLATRYGVPASAILATNGLSSASQLTPGSRLTIPFYSAGGAATPRAQAPAITPVAEAPVMQSTPAPVAPRAAATPRPPQPVTEMTQRGETVRSAATPVPSRAPAPAPLPAPRPVISAAPPARENEPARIVPPAQVAAPRAVASASADAAREKARAQAEAAKVRAEAAKQQTAASRSADAEVAARKAAEARAKAESERARLAETRAKTAEDRAKAAEASRQADANRIKAAEAKQKAEAERKQQAEAKAKADRELKAARADAVSAERKAKEQEARLAREAARPARQQAAAAAPAAAAATAGAAIATQRQPVDPAPTSSVPKDEPKAASAAPSADFRWPARGRVISGFSGKGANEGINIAVPEGTPVKAAGDGVVAYSGNELKGYGNLVLIRHDNGYVSAYAHNGDIAVKRGEKVSRGQTIAKSGQSGNVASPQLHFEIRKGSTPVDPMPYLAN
jgi:murein DD-endopeptidase MepM/ murein hydrolase activator NlpD